MEEWQNFVGICLIGSREEDIKMTKQKMTKCPVCDEKIQSDKVTDKLVHYTCKKCDTEVILDLKK